MRFLKRRKRTPRRPRVLDAVVEDLAKAYASRPRLTARAIAYGGYLETCPGCGHMFSCGHIANRKQVQECLGA